MLARDFFTLPRPPLNPAPMRSPPDCLRLCAALLLSAALHAALLFPWPHGGAGRGGATGPKPAETTLRARIVVRQDARAPTPAAPAPTGPATPPPAPGSDAGPPDPGRFYGTHELSRAPRPMDDVDLDIPEAALLTRAGTLVLTLRIDASGQVVAYAVDAPELPEEFTTALAETFRAVRFSPGEIAGHKVSSVLKVEISFDAAPEERR